MNGFGAESTATESRSFCSWENMMVLDYQVTRGNLALNYTRGRVGRQGCWGMLLPQKALCLSLSMYFPTKDVLRGAGRLLSS